VLTAASPSLTGRGNARLSFTEVTLPPGIVPHTCRGSASFLALHHVGMLQLLITFPRLTKRGYTPQSCQSYR
jgi:hypothetical protein